MWVIRPRIERRIRNRSMWLGNYWPCMVIFLDRQTAPNGETLAAVATRSLSIYYLWNSIYGQLNVHQRNGRPLPSPPMHPCLWCAWPVAVLDASFTGSGSRRTVADLKVILPKVVRPWRTARAAEYALAANGLLSGTLSWLWTRAIVEQAHDCRPRVMDLFDSEQRRRIAVKSALW